MMMVFQILFEVRCIRGVAKARGERVAVADGNGQGEAYDTISIFFLAHEAHADGDDARGSWLELTNVERDDVVAGLRKEHRGLPSDDGFFVDDLGILFGKDLGDDLRLVVDARFQAADRGTRQNGKIVDEILDRLVAVVAEGLLHGRASRLVGDLDVPADRMERVCGRVPLVVEGEEAERREHSGRQGSDNTVGLARVTRTSACLLVRSLCSHFDFRELAGLFPLVLTIPTVSTSAEPRPTCAPSCCARSLPLLPLALAD